MTWNNDLALLKEAFKDKYGSLENTHIYQAPGRVNLIGEHTDYNGGLVLPFAIDKSISLIIQPRKDKYIKLSSLNFNHDVTCDISDISYKAKDMWTNYPKGVIKTLQEMGYSFKGLNLLYSSNIPIGQGLSSSAAVEVVTCYAFVNHYKFKIKIDKIPSICQKAENEFMGMRCGIMDQFVITLAQANHSMLLNCRSLDFEFVPFADRNIKIVIGNTKVSRNLVNSAYNMRREECERGVSILSRYLKGIKQLSDISIDDFKRLEKYLPQPIRDRCCHVIYENERVRQAVKALKDGNYTRLGRLMVLSHKSLKKLYKVSCRELDIMVDSALKVKGVLGSRMTGAGFGGCTISLVKENIVDEFINKVGQLYKRKTGMKPEFYSCIPVSGVRKIK
jgi:galactokinase